MLIEAFFRNKSDAFQAWMKENEKISQQEMDDVSSDSGATDCSERR